jgi:dihydroorotate dehydrogenase electron transfer subunit
VTDPAFVGGAVVAEQIETEPGFFRLVCRVPASFPDPAPGQFVQLRLSERTDPLLPRPYGIVDFTRHADHATFELYYGVVGAGTKLLSRFRAGESIHCIGPLGRGYTVDPARPAILVAGGRGVAPLLMLYAREKPRRASLPFVYGFRTKALSYGLERIAEGDRVLATDDGSLGRRGTALDALAALPAATLKDAVLYACGPEILLERTARFAIEHALDCQVSLETPFACGVGICRGCAVPKSSGDGYWMCCSDGPVFEARQIGWEALHVG